MNGKTTWQKLKIPVIVTAGIVVVALAIWLIIAMTSGGGIGGVKNMTSHGSEGSINDQAISVANIERLPMSDARCDDVIMLFSNKEGKDCIIADLTITNNSGKPYEFNPLFLQTIDPSQEGDYQPLPPYRDESTRMAHVTIAPSESFTYKLYVVAETGQELDLSFITEDGMRERGEEVLVDLT
jgi:hypothetical protein